MDQVVVRRVSELTGVAHELTLPIHPDKWERWLSMTPSERPFIQVFFPELNEDEREFILTGITPDEWDEAFGEAFDEEALDDE